MTRIIDTGAGVSFVPAPDDGSPYTEGVPDERGLMRPKGWHCAYGCRGQWGHRVGAHHSWDCPYWKHHPHATPF